MKRTPMPRGSGFKRKTIERTKSVATPIPMHLRRNAVFARMDVPAEPQPKGVATKPGKRSPTKEEAAWMEAITALGCIACLLDGHPGTPGAVHHLLSGGRRIGHLHTICLCDPGHHQNGQQFDKVSRHPWKARFEKQYGSEEALLLLTKKILSTQGAWA